MHEARAIELLATSHVFCGFIVSQARSFDAGVYASRLGLLSDGSFADHSNEDATLVSPNVFIRTGHPPLMSPHARVCKDTIIKGKKNLVLYYRLLYLYTVRLLCLLLRHCGAVMRITTGFG